MKGKNYILKDNGFKDVRGVYDLKVSEMNGLQLLVKGNIAQPELQITNCLKCEAQTTSFFAVAVKTASAPHVPL